MSYKVTIGGVDLIDEPKNLKESNVEIKRDDEIKGIFVQFIADLEFWGDGYKVLNSALNATSFCSPISCVIQENCENGFLFDGLIFPSSVEWDETRCIIKATVEDNTAQARILRLKDVVVQVNSGKTINNEDIVDIGASISVLSQTPTMYQCYELMQYIVSYITDNEVILDSDILQNEKFVVDEYQLAFSGSVAIGESIDIFFVDIYGQNQNITITSVTNTLTGINNFHRQVAAELSHTFPGLDFINFNMTRPYYSDTTAGESPVVIRFMNDSQLSINTSGAPSLIATLSQTKNYQYGLADLYFCSAGSVGGDSITSLSFADLFVFLDSMANLSMSFYNIGAQQYLKVALEPDFFDGTVLFGINNINNMTRRPYNEWTIGTLQYQPVSGITPYLPPISSSSYVGAECLNKERRTDWGKFRVNAPPNVDGDSQIFVGSSENDTSIVSFDITFWNGSFPAFVGATPNLIPKQMFSQHVARQWSFRSNGLRNNGFVISPIYSLLFSFVISFEFPLNINEYNALSQNPERIIEANGGMSPSSKREGYILNASYNIKTGITQFQLLIE